MFQITSTLYGASEIGQFYSGTDNIAMTELTCTAACPPPLPGAADAGARVHVPRGRPGADHILLEVPQDFFFPMLHVLACTEAVAADVVDVQDAPGDGKFAQVVVVPTARLREPLLLPEPQEVPWGASAAARPVTRGGSFGSEDASRGQMGAPVPSASPIRQRPQPLTATPDLECGDGPAWDSFLVPPPEAPPPPTPPPPVRLRPALPTSDFPLQSAGGLTASPLTPSSPSGTTSPTLRRTVGECLGAEQALPDPWRTLTSLGPAASAAESATDANTTGHWSSLIPYQDVPRSGVP